MIGTLAAVMFWLQAEPASPPTVFLRGPVTDDTVARALDALERSRARRLQIRSGGGHTLASLKLARFVKTNRISVVVDDHCLSACVNILIASPEPRVPASALVLIHPGSLGIHRWAAAYPGETSHMRLVAETREEAGQIVEIFGDDAIAVLARAFASHRPFCVRTPSDSGRSTIGYQSQWWMPARSVLEAVGVLFEGDWPSSIDAAISYIDGRVSREAAISFGTGAPPETVKGPLPPCR